MGKSSLGDAWKKPTVNKALTVATMLSCAPTLGSAEKESGNQAAVPTRLLG